MCLVPNLGGRDLNYARTKAGTHRGDRFADAELRDQLLCVGGGRRHSLNRTAGGGNESKISIFEAMRRGAESPDAVTEAAEWLADYLALMDGRARGQCTDQSGRQNR
jgi:hypothetical protein